MPADQAVERTSLPENLLLVTNPQRLRSKIGSRAAIAVLKHLEETARFLPVSGRTPDEEASRVVAAARAMNADGVVIVGDYDVLAPERVNILRREEHALRREDDDHFFAWTDDCYGDWRVHQRGTPQQLLLAQLPVSRIPDNRSADYIVQALTRRAKTTSTATGIRNARRPFADATFAAISPAVLEKSAPFYSRQHPPYLTAGDLMYLVLHGERAARQRYYGEDANEDFLTALEPRNIGAQTGAVIFSSACWSACLSVAAYALRSRWPPSREALARIFLLRGASAFIGPTGVHCSPMQPPYDYASAPFHQLFLKSIRAGSAPARALLEAKHEYASKMYYNATNDWYESASERRVIAQFTCLGLGW